MAHPCLPRLGAGEQDTLADDGAGARSLGGAGDHAEVGRPGGASPQAEHQRRVGRHAEHQVAVVAGQVPDVLGVQQGPALWSTGGHAQDVALSLCAEQPHPDPVGCGRGAPGTVATRECLGSRQGPGVDVDHGVADGIEVAADEHELVTAQGGTRDGEPRRGVAFGDQRHVAQPMPVRGSRGGPIGRGPDGGQPSRSPARAARPAGRASPRRPGGRSAARPPGRPHRPGGPAGRSLVGRSR